MKVKIDFSVDEVYNKIQKNVDKAQIELDAEILRNSNEFIPFDTGKLSDSGENNTIFGTGEVKWKTDYARRLYYNDGYNFSKDVNPFASSHWFEHAKSRYIDNWINMVQDMMIGGK